MELTAVLTDRREEILQEACAGLTRLHPAHYEAVGEEVTRQRLAELFDVVRSAIADRDLSEIATYCTRLAHERFDAGFDIAEVQSAFNALEQAVWRAVVAVTPAAELAEPIGMLSTVLGYGKDTLAREWVSLASRRHVPTLDLMALFSGPAS